MHAEIFRFTVYDVVIDLTSLTPAGAPCAPSPPPEAPRCPTQGPGRRRGARRQRPHRHRLRPRPVPAAAVVELRAGWPAHRRRNRSGRGVMKRGEADRGRRCGSDVPPGCRQQAPSYGGDALRRTAFRAAAACSATSWSSSASASSTSRSIGLSLSISGDP